MTDVVVTTGRGKVRGREENGISRFLGIPYAAAPFGSHRFRRPVEPPAWEGVADALEFGPTAPGADLPGAFLTDPRIPGEQCLNLNVWSAELGGAGRAVLVWIHGGANVTGSSAQPIFDGEEFARSGLVFVSVNFRIGIEGFALLPGAPANRALLDQIAALEWIRDNISAFGGDPANVTICGTSAGAGSVMALLSLGTGLFRRAVLQSGALQVALPAGDATLVTAEIARRAGVAPTVAGLTPVAPGDLAGIARDIHLEMPSNPDPAIWGKVTLASGMPLGPVVDGDFVRRHPWDAVLAGAGQEVDLLLGTNTDEMLMLLGGGVPPEVATAITETVFRAPVYQLAESRTGATFVYEFGWPSPLPDVGAAHGLELGFIFGNLGHSMLEGQDPPRRLSDSMHESWVAFATDGDPGWPAFTPVTKSVMLFTTESSPGVRSQ